MIYEVTQNKILILQVRPMQAEIGGDRMRGAARPTRWIPAEVWQRQGMTAQVLTLPGGKYRFSSTPTTVLLDCFAKLRFQQRHLK